MSVTFSPAIDTTTPLVFVVECADGIIREEARGSHEAMLEVFVAHRDGGTCPVEDCRIYGPMLTTLEDESEPKVNVSNVNARLVLDALGLPFEDGTGSLPAEDFWGRVLMA